MPNQTLRIWEYQMLCWEATPYIGQRTKKQAGELN